MNNKKVLLISGIVGPLKSSNNSFTNTVKGYLNNGFKVYHFAFYNKRNTKYELFELLENKNYKFFGIPYFVSYFLDLNGKKRSKKRGKNDYIIESIHPNEIIKPDSEISKTQYFFNLFYSIFEGIRLLLIAPFIRPDIIYAYEIFGVTSGYFIAKILNKPLIKRFQGTYIDKDNINSKKTLFHKKVYEKDCTLNIMTNDGTKGDEVLRKLGFSEEKILFLVNGLDERIRKSIREKDLEKFKLKLDLGDKDLVLGIFNRFYPFKRIDRAVYLLKELKEELDKPYLLIGGMGGPTESTIRKMVKNFHLEDNVKFLGEIQYDDMFLYYKVCDVILLLNDYANTGNQLLEAAYLGKQTIAVDDENNSKIFKFENIHYVNPYNFLEESVKLSMEIYKNKNNIEERINNKILSWEQRMDIEIKKVEEILGKNC